MDERLPLDVPHGNGWPWWDAWGLPFQLVVIAVIGWFFFRWLRPRPAFQIDIENQIPRIVWGRVRPAFLTELTAMLPMLGIQRGTITGRNGGQRIVLKFSREFSPGAQQQVRNVWFAS
jgi:hypothetical protein